MDAVLFHTQDYAAFLIEPITARGERPMAQSDQNYRPITQSLVPGPFPTFGGDACMETLQGRALRLVNLVHEINANLDRLDPDSVPPSQPSADKPGPLPGLAELLDTAAHLLEVAAGRSSHIQNRVGRL